MPDVVRDPAALRWLGGASVVLVGADQADVLARAAPGPSRGRVRRRARTASATGCSGAPWRSARPSVVELPQAEAWLVELLTDVGDGGTRRARTIGVVGGSGGAGATTFAGALALTAAADGPDGPRRRRPARSRASTGSSVSTRARALRRRPLGPARRSTRPAQLALAARGAAGPGRARRADLGGGAAGAARRRVACGRCSRPPQRGHDVVVVDLPRADDDPWGRGGLALRPACWSSAEPTVAGVSSAGRVAASLRPLTRDVALVVRGAGRRSPPTTSPTPRAAAARRGADQRGLAEHDRPRCWGRCDAPRSPLARSGRARSLRAVA